VDHTSAQIPNETHVQHGIVGLNVQPSVLNPLPLILVSTSSTVPISLLPVFSHHSFCTLQCSVPFVVWFIPPSPLVAGKANSSGLKVGHSISPWYFLCSPRSTYSYQRQKYQSPFRAHSRRHLHIPRCWLQETLEINHRFSIIGRIFSVGRHRDPVKFIATFRY